MKENQAEKLQDAIGEVQDRYIEEAHNTQAAQAAKNRQKKRAVWRRAVAIAACFAVLATAGLIRIFPRYGSAEPEEAAVEYSKDDTEAAAEVETPGEAAYEEAAEGSYEWDGEAYESADGAYVTGHSSATGQIQQQYGSAYVLTAAQWNDNHNWPFFTNLVSAGLVDYPSFGLDPRWRIKVTVLDSQGKRLPRETVTLEDGNGDVLWTAISDDNGEAYLFCPQASAFDEEEEYVRVNGTTEVVHAMTGQGQQNNTLVFEDVTVSTRATAQQARDLQVMFIMDTTGSMSDELAFLQKDFAAIAEDVGHDGVSFSVNFYRDDGDEYVTRCNPFTNNVREVQNLLNAEYADGGGDEPEAVAQILEETLTMNSGWRSDCSKVAFLIFDAPPHMGQEEETKIKRAVESAAAQGIHLVPVVASNAERYTEIFGRALAIMTNGEYVFLTDDSGVGNEHLEPIIGDYNVELLHDIIVRIIESYR